MSEHIQTVVIGAGVVGLAIARKLAMSGREVILLESEDAIGTATSSRNSVVIHAGIYYPKGSFKARFCVEGNKLMYAYCAERSFLSAAEITELEPNIDVSGALYSPSTGIVDSHSLMLSYQGEAEDHGAMIAFKSPVIGGRIEDGAIWLSVGGDAPMELTCDEVINSAGLGAQTISRRIEGNDPDTIPELFYAKGNYYTLTGNNPFNHLIYPVPVANGLGTHSSMDMGGQTKFGPDVEWIDDIDYVVDPKRGDSFYASIRRFWPGLPDGSIQPGYSGIRPNLIGPGGKTLNTDFIIQGRADHGIEGMVNLYGIESPGLTSSMAIADYVLERLERG